MPEERRLPLGRLSVNGFSRSTVATYLHVPEVHAMFDLGACPGDAAAAHDVFLSHLHIDHAQALPYYAAHRNMLRMTPGRVHVPAGTGKGVRAFVDALARLQGPDEVSRFEYELTEMEPGAERPLRGGRRVRSFATHHRVPSLGFTVLERKEKLAPGYAHLSGREIAEKKRAGEPVTEPHDTAIFSYLGDTGAQALDEHPEALAAEVLVAECTFLAPEHKENARETLHLHLDDFVERAALFTCDALVLTHFSMRYRDAEIRERLMRALPEDLWARVHVLI